MKKLRFGFSLIVASLLANGCASPNSGQYGSSSTVDSVYLSLSQPLMDRSWQDYYRISNRLREIDENFIRKELQQAGLTETFAPPYAHRFGFDPRQSIDFYLTEEGKRIADIIVSFQTPSGGWSKRTAMSERPRRHGEAFGVEQHYIPTFDNDATSTQIRELIKAYQATEEVRYRDAVLRGLKLILLAQYPNGGWPQTYPLRGGYHDHITYNDGVMTNLLELIHDASSDQELAFLPDDLRKLAQLSHQRGIESVLATQIIVDGRRTIWGAQHDPRSMLPAAARAFEPESLATAESAHLLMSLMKISDPSAELIAAIHAAAAWFEDNSIYGYKWVAAQENRSRLQAKQGAGPIWARFVEIGTNRPLFGDRDGTIYYDVDEISPERQEGYAWYTDAPSEFLEAYKIWRQRYQH